MERLIHEKVAKVFDSLLSISMFLSSLLLVFTTLAVCTDVILRYFFNRPLVWVDEISEYILLYLTFLGTAWVFKREGHVVVDILLIKLSERRRALLNAISSLLCVPISLWLVWYGAQVTWDHYQRGIYNPTLLEFPKALVIAVIPVGSFLLLVEILRRFWGCLNTWRTLKREG